MHLPRFRTPQTGVSERHITTQLAQVLLTTQWCNALLSWTAKRILRHSRLGEQIHDGLWSLVFLSSCTSSLLTVCAWGDIFRSSCLSGLLSGDAEEEVAGAHTPSHASTWQLTREGGVPEDRGGRLPPTNLFRAASATVGLNATSSLLLTRLASGMKMHQVNFYDQWNHLWYLIGFDSHSCSGAADQALPVHRSTTWPITGSDSVCWQDYSHRLTCSVSVYVTRPEHSVLTARCGGTDRFISCISILNYKLTAC